MKKFFAIALCALMMLSLSVAAFAADENVFEYNFEDDAEGDWIAIDGTLKVVPKNGTIEVVKFDNNMCMKVSHPDGNGTKYDPYVNFLEGGTDTFGCGTQFVVEYDVYFESACDGMSWQILCSRETPAAGTQFQQVGYVKNADLAVMIEGQSEPATHLELKKWYRFAVAYDLKNDCFSVYLDGVCLAKDADYTVTDTSAETASLLRTAFQSWDAGEAVAYLDNVVIYNAEKPRNIKTDAPATTAAPVTEAPATEAPTTQAPVTAAPTTGTTTTPAAQTADIAVVIAAVAAIAASGAVIVKKKH